MRVIRPLLIRDSHANVGDLTIHSYDSVTRVAPWLDKLVIRGLDLGRVHIASERVGGAPTPIVYAGVVAIGVHDPYFKIQGLGVWGDWS